jgi:hypothetical protein
LGKDETAFSFFIKYCGFEITTAYLNEKSFGMKKGWTSNLSVFETGD